jgi:hypothetical protein
MKMIKGFEYQSGFGPNNNLPLDLSISYLIEVPVGYGLSVDSSNHGEWECVSCIYSLQSGAKIWETGNYERAPLDGVTYTVWGVSNYSHDTMSFLITAWHKKSPPNENEVWHQTPNCTTLRRFTEQITGSPTQFITLIKYDPYGNRDIIENTYRITIERDYSYMKYLRGE